MNYGSDSQGGPTYGLVVVTPPATEPVTLAELKAHCRVDIADDDSHLTALITAARVLIEQQANTALVTQTLRLTLDYFPACPPWEIRLPRSPLQSITSVKYYDLNQTLQTLDPTRYDVDTTQRPGRVRPAPSFWWPLPAQVYRGLPLFRMDAVQITFVAGYSTVPETAKLAIKLLVGHWYETREAVSEAALRPVPLAFDALAQSLWDGST